VQDAASDSVLDGDKTYHVPVVTHGAEDLFESVAADEFYVLALKISMGGYIVKATFYTLYGYPFHLFFFVLLIFSTYSL